ncbi:uncharacterized protein Dmoj_GI26695 [Drosophila mojavensis]|uniref:Uncharacterized protein n=1 Tax=Drosophila mojavensis TaxID=7230 RepID=A0A0Q9XAD8_DROMO|nr:uncharacterized protein Dmoj_GI26695 [Drosophila mojavensis]
MREREGGSEGGFLLCQRMHHVTTSGSCMRRGMFEDQHGMWNVMHAIYTCVNDTALAQIEYTYVVKVSTDMVPDLSINRLNNTCQQDPRG